jgi:rhodanese-related sulfurtransferase
MTTAVDRHGVRVLLSRGAQLVEVLGEAEYRREHLPGAMSIPLHRLTDEAPVRLRRDRPVVVYCWDWLCDLSPRAAHRLEALGFEDVHDYTAGKLDWVAAGEPVEGDDVGPRLRDLGGEDVPRCTLDEQVADAVARAGEWDVVAVVDRADVVLGLLRVADVAPDDRRSVAEVAQEAPDTWRPHLSVHEMAGALREHPLPRVVVTHADGRLHGVVAPDDVFLAAKHEHEEGGR